MLAGGLVGCAAEADTVIQTCDEPIDNVSGHNYNLEDEKQESSDLNKNHL